jgi:hypothetical protein
MVELQKNKRKTQHPFRKEKKLVVRHQKGK